MTALRTWFASRAALALLVLAGGWQVFGGRSESWLAGWDSWDATYFTDIARHGYGGSHGGKEDFNAFFPGFPLVVRAFHAVVPSWTAAGLLVSLVFGAIAVVYLARLAEDEGTDGSWAVLALVLSPYAVFLAAGYSESLFLAAALPGWLAARRGRWGAASLLVAGACLVRVNGAFLAIALVVLWLTQSRDAKVLPWLGVPFVALASWAAYLHRVTGDWQAWQHAQEHVWGRHLTAPTTALRTTWDLARNPQISPEQRWSYGAQIVCVAIAVVVVVVLAYRREFAEAVYVLLSVGALATSSFYFSIDRSTLLWFPMWVLLARALAGRPWLQWTYVVLATPLMVSGVLTFHDGRWVG